MTCDSKENSKLRVGALSALACAVSAGVVIFVLTEQVPEVTSSESSFVNGVLEELLDWVPGLHAPGSELWLGIHIRHWAHAVEFGVFGLFVALATLLFRHGKAISSSVTIAFAICLCCSLVDQYHKLFVPGRHFDWFDLAMDALGYVPAIAIVAVAVFAVRWASRKNTAR